MSQPRHEFFIRDMIFGMLELLPKYGLFGSQDFLLFFCYRCCHYCPLELRQLAFARKLKVLLSAPSILAFCIPNHTTIFNIVSIHSGGPRAIPLILCKTSFTTISSLDSPLLSEDDGGGDKQIDEGTLSGILNGIMRRVSFVCGVVKEHALIKSFGCRA